MFTRLLLCASIGALAFGSSASAESVGTASAVNVTTTGTPPGATKQVLQIGSQVVRNERIETSGSGSMQVMFIDKTSLNIGPSTSIVIDEFVYNPVEGTGSMSLRLGKGVLRVVGGQVTHTGGATVTTSAATVGIRGGAVTISHCPAPGDPGLGDFLPQRKQKGRPLPQAPMTACDTQGTRAILHFGNMSVSTLNMRGEPGAVQDVIRPGFGTTVASAFTPPAPAIRVPQSEINQLNTALTSKPSQNGGSAAVPSNALAAKSGVGAGASADPSTVASRQPQNTAGQTQASIASTAQVVQAAQLTAQQAQQLATAQSTAQTTRTQPSTPTPPSPPPLTTSAFVLTTSVDAAKLGQSTYPYLTASFVTSGTTSVVTPIYGYRVGSPAASPNPAHVMQANLVVTGQGAAQSSTISLMTAYLAQDTINGETLAGGFSASARSCATCYQTRASGAVSSQPSSISIDSNALPTGSFGTNQNLFTFQTHSYTAQQAQTNAGGLANYTFDQTVSAGGTVPAGLGSNHPNAQLQGYAAGIMQTIRLNSTGTTGQAATNPYIVASGSTTPGDVTINLVDGTSRMGAVFNVAAAKASNSGLTPGSGYIGTNAGLIANSLQTASFRFGAAPTMDPTTVSGTNSARAAYIDYETFGARSETLMDPVTGAQKETSVVNGKVLNGAALPGGFADGIVSLMVVSDVVGANSTSFLSSLSNTTVTPCACDYTKWGFWSVDAYQNDSTTNSGYANRGTLNTWVAGVPANAVDLPTTGTATYVGAAVATISANALPGATTTPAAYLAAGNFSNTVNFGNRTGLVTISNLDNATYSGGVTILPNSTAFSGNLAGSTGGRAMSLNGSFFQGGPNNISPKYGEMGGQFGIYSTSTTYIGAGTFAARRVN